MRDRQSELCLERRRPRRRESSLAVARDTAAWRPPLQGRHRIDTPLSRHEFLNPSNHALCGRDAHGPRRRCFRTWREGLAKLAAVYLVSLFRFVIWVGLVISWLFFAGLKPPLAS